MDDKQPPATEREQTDESLSRERNTADEKLALQVEAAEKVADTEIEQERVRSDERLEDARDGRAGAGAVDIDRAIRAEREQADERISHDRTAMAEALPDVRDETDRHLQEERTRADTVLSARDTLLGVVSHDLRNMLNSVVGYAALMGKEGARLENVKVSQCAERIERSGKRMERLVGDLLDLVSIEAGVLAAKLDDGDLGLVAAEVVEDAQAQAAQVGVTLTLDLAAELPVTRFDSLRIVQVLTNLTNNALKFTPSGGSISVRLRSDVEGVQVTVQDSGIGIRAADLEAVFARHVQVDSNDRRGVGLGLYIAQSIVRGHGGRLWAQSVLGEGSSFHFTLPMPTTDAAA